MSACARKPQRQPGAKKGAPPHEFECSKRSPIQRQAREARDSESAGATTTAAHEDPRGHEVGARECTKVTVAARRAIAQRGTRARGRGRREARQ